MTLDTTYLRGFVVDVFSVIRQATYPENIVFHFTAASHCSCCSSNFHHIITSTFHLYYFNSNLVRGKISYSVHRTLDQPLTG
ncbi:galacturonosyltransferase-like 3 [Pyrus ussuriensis x Pyrus communis]|uniref:Galacturonosyltransferase-like 3 n=1 Tax=Pyrus ussuriensis x Pyrus communis TaxID=2448454 RepID=A0A5N5F8Q6_9ROSA|nr:galacturonosyltransferase-like 3 [Pyrus ussuriensis x Pyrus communis]